MRAKVGVRSIVDKRREILLFENVRIHLDEVQGLGSFLELEAVLSADDPESDAHGKIEYLLGQLEIARSQLVATSYADMG